LATILVSFTLGNFSKVAFWPYARLFAVQRGPWPKWPNGKYNYALNADFEDCDFTSTTSQSRDVINDVTNRRAVGTFLWPLYWTRTPKSLSFRDI